MGESVLTPEEIFLGKVLKSMPLHGGVFFARQWGKGNSGQNSETGLWGTELCNEDDDGRSPG